MGDTEKKKYEKPANRDNDDDDPPATAASDEAALPGGATGRWWWAWRLKQQPVALTRLLAAFFVVYYVQFMLRCDFITGCYYLGSMRRARMLSYVLKKELVCCCAASSSECLNEEAADNADLTLPTATTAPPASQAFSARVVANLEIATARTEKEGEERLNNRGAWSYNATPLLAPAAAGQNIITRNSRLLSKLSHAAPMYSMPRALNLCSPLLVLSSSSSSSVHLALCVTFSCAGARTDSC